MEYKELGCCAGLQKRLECPSPFFLLPEGKARAAKLLIFTVFGLLRHWECLISLSSHQVVSPKNKGISWASLFFFISASRA